MTDNLTKEQLDTEISAATLNRAEAREHIADAALSELQLEREKEKDIFDRSQDYRHGFVTFAAEVNPETVLALVSTLRRLTRMRPGQEIDLCLNSPGGSITDGFHLIDDIRTLGVPVNIIVRGQACSMAAVVLQAGTRRFIGQSSFLMLHRASFGAKGTTAEVEDAVEESKMMETAIYGILAARSGRTVAFWRKKLSARKDVWFTAEEAVEVGLADAIA